MDSNVTFYQELVYFTCIFRIVVIIFSTNKRTFLKQFHKMCLRKLPSQHGDVSVRAVELSKPSNFHVNLIVILRNKEIRVSRF